MTQSLRLMSEMGHLRLNWAALVMSGLPPVATVAKTSKIGSFVHRSRHSAALRAVL